MATYKVLQDIEAEDTLVGPLTLRQCIYAAIALLCGYLSFIVISKHAAFLAIPLLPFIALGVFFAFPWNKQQPTEVWALAKVRFALKPRKRIWNQTGVQQLVTITAPKVLKRTVRSLSQNEVQSRLRALADTIDSRGWAVKNIELGYYTRSSLNGAATDSDRLVSPSNMPQDVPTVEDSASSDIFDTQFNPVAQKFDQMMSKSAGEHRQQIEQQLSQQASPSGDPLQTTEPEANYWHHMRTIMPPGGGAAPGAGTGGASNPAGAFGTAPAATPRGTLPSPVMPWSVPASNGAPQDASAAVGAGGQSVTAGPDPAILDLANNNDLNVATIAREAQARKAEPPDEVTVSFH